jgi:hypothetical protein
MLADGKGSTERVIEEGGYRTVIVINTSSLLCYEHVCVCVYTHILDKRLCFLFFHSFIM